MYHTPKYVKVLQYIAMILMALFMFFPIYWIFVNSLKTINGISAWPPEFFPSDPQWGNYIEVLKIAVPEAIRNSGVKPELGHRLYRVVKRTVDIVAAGGALVLLFIPGVILSVVICIKSPGASPLYSQWRVGRVRKDGTFYLFKIYKFRSMVPNADQMLKDLQAQNEATGPMFKMKHDPRIIPGVGNFIRKHSIDELPQLINVFLGQMNLIGPRPGLPREVALYSEHDMKRLAVKPGCSGPWQVMGRSYLGFKEMVELDLRYIENRSLRQDLRLIFGTLKTMFSGEGAV